MESTEFNRPSIKRPNAPTLRLGNERDRLIRSQDLYNNPLLGPKWHDMWEEAEQKVTTENYPDYTTQG